MHILVTNGDGVLAPGLLALAQAMRDLGQMSTRSVAPDRNWSGGGHVKTIDRALRVREVRSSDGTSAWASDGARSDCVALATLGSPTGVPDRVDLVVSGINPVANIGHDVAYALRGTVTAAMEAVIWDTPAVAVSPNSPEDYVGELDYGPAANAARQIVQAIMQHGMPAGVLLKETTLPCGAAPCGLERITA